MYEYRWRTPLLLGVMCNAGGVYADRELKIWLGELLVAVNKGIERRRGNIGTS